MPLELHLSLSGSERLARNLKIGSYADIVIKRSYSKPRQAYTHKHNNTQKPRTKNDILSW